jgi:hypothetical protein
MDSSTLELSSARSKDRAATCKVEAISSVCTILKAVKPRRAYIMQSY